MNQLVEVPHQLQIEPEFSMTTDASHAMMENIHPGSFKEGINFLFIP